MVFVMQPEGSVPKCRYNYIDKSGRRLFDTSYIDGKDFSEGLAPVGDGTHWGYVDKKGVVRIPLRFDDAEPFYEELAKVYLGGKWGYIEKSGAFAIAPAFDHAENFSEGLAVAIKGDDQFWFIDRKGRQAFPQIYSGASSFAMGLAHVREDLGPGKSRRSYIDRTGKAIFTY